MHNPASYFEIPVSNLKRATVFYSEVFGYDFEFEEIHGNQMALFPFSNDKPGITGALAQGDIYKPTKEGTLIYFHVRDISTTLLMITKNGGKILFPKTEVGSYGYVAEFEDSEGNRVGLFEPRK